ALGIDHHLLDDPGGALEQPAEQMRFAGARIALDEQTRREQLLDVEMDGLARAAGADVDSCGHAGCVADRGGAAQAGRQEKAVDDSQPVTVTQRRLGSMSLISGMPSEKETAMDS